MRRLDRAMFAIFLLALLADVAWSQVPAAVGGDATGGLILSAAGQLRDGSSWDEAVDLRRANRVLAPRPGFRSYRRANSVVARSVWSQVLSGDAWKFRTTHLSVKADRADQSVAILLANADFGRSPARGSQAGFRWDADVPSLGVFAHSGTPAP